MSKLTRHQLRAMVEKIQATIDSHERRPGTPSNVKRLEESQAKLARYRAELAEREGEQDAEIDRVEADREAQEAAQDAEQNRSQAPEPVIHIAPRHQRITPPPARTEPDDELANLCRSILQRWTLGTVIDQLWQSEAKLFGTLTEPRVTRAKARTA